MKKYNIVTAKIINKNGEEKKIWNNVGSLVQFDGEDAGMALDLHMFPNTKFYVFEQTDRKQKTEVESDTTIEPEQLGEDVPF